MVHGVSAVSFLLPASRRAGAAREHFEWRALRCEHMRACGCLTTSPLAKLERPVGLPRRHLVIWVCVNIRWILGANSNT
ncbi:unnamed protein product [Urochloa humidicola]